MAPQRPPSSPTSLLWVHQLKRENGFLLDRMKILEAEIARVESRTIAEAGTTGAKEIAAIAKKVESLAENDSEAAMGKIRAEVMERLEDVGADIEAVTLQVSTLSRIDDGLTNERRRAVESEKALLKRIKDVEGSMREHERGLLEVGKKANGQTVAEICKDLKKLSGQVERGEKGMEEVQFSLKKLEQIGKVLRESNERLAEDVKELAERPVQIAAPAVVATTPQDADETVAGPKESHEGDQGRPQTPPPTKKLKTAKKKTAASKAARKAPVRSAPKQPARKAQPNSARGVTTAKKATTEPQQPLIDERLKLPVVRRGKGWVEVEEESDGADEPTVR